MCFNKYNQWICLIQKGLRPQFSASPNKAPFQLNSRKAGSKSSSQERPFLRPQLIKPRCVWAPGLCQTWNLSLHLLAAVRVQCSLPNPWKAGGHREERGIGLLPPEIRGLPYLTFPTYSVRVSNHRHHQHLGSHHKMQSDSLAASQCMLLLLSPLPLPPFSWVCLSPPLPYPLLFQISFSVDFAKRLPSSLLSLWFPPLLSSSKLFLSVPCLLAFLRVSFGSVSFDTGPRPTAKFQTH